MKEEGLEMRSCDLFEPKWENDCFTVTRTELRRHFYAILRFVDARDDEGVPTVVFITYKGKRDLVLMSVNSYEKTFGMERLERLLAEAEKETDDGGNGE